MDIELIIKDYIKVKEMSFDDFIKISSHLEEHDYYVVRNTFKHLILSAQPDTVEVLCKAIEGNQEEDGGDYDIHNP